MIRPFLVLAMAANLTACASLPDAPLQAADDPEFAAPEEIKLPGLPSDAPAPMTLLPGDVIALRIFSESPMEVPGLVVDERGSLSVPLAGDVEVRGLTLDAARDAIEAALHRYDRYARALVTVSEAAGHRATVVGAVENPGAYILRPGMRLAELVAVTGGPKSVSLSTDTYELADLDAARVVRDGAALPVSVPRALEGDPLHNVRIRPGDLLFMPRLRGERISVLGEVRSPTTVPFYRGLRLTEALARAGGSLEGADNGDIRVIRGPLSRPKVYTASLKALRDGDGHDVLLEPGDVVYVTEHWFATATGVVQRLTPVLAAAAFGAALATPKSGP